MDSFIPWIGGKKLLRKQITACFPEKMKRYIEVFGGAGWVLFSKEKHADLEVYNDVEGDLVNLFRCAKHHPQELQRELSFMLNAKEFFEDYRSQLGSEGLTDIQRAARYLTLIKISYGADRRSYGGRKKDVLRYRAYLTEIEKRLRSVVIQNKDFEALIRQYDSEQSFFYADPPYHTTEHHYDAVFQAEDHERLKATLQAIQGKFLLSYNDDEYIRSLYRGYEIIEVERKNNLNARYKDKEQRYKELLIKNY